jgi:hypothetical protein
VSYADGLITSGERIIHRAKQHWWVFVWGARYTLLAIVIAVVFFVLGGALGPDGISGTFRTVLSWITAALFIGGLALLLWTTLRYLNQEYVITTRRVIQVEGVVNKRAVDSSLEKINDAVLEQSIFGRALDFGDLRILTASEAAISDFRMLRRPVVFKKAMLEAKHEYEQDLASGFDDDDRPSPPMRVVPPPPAVPPATAASPTAAAPVPMPIGDDETRRTAAPVASAAPAGSADAPASSGAPARSSNSEDLTDALAALADLRDRGAISAEEYDQKKTDILRRL